MKKLVSALLVLALAAGCMVFAAFVKNQVTIPDGIYRDGFTGATVRSSKIISALNDALARGAYKLAE